MRLDSANKRILIKTRKHEMLATVLPIEVLHPEVISVPHTDEAIRVLRNLGADTRGLEPIHTKWDWPSLGGEPLRPDQKVTAAFLSTTTRGYCLHPPRMGKTCAALTALLYLLDTGQINGALIICPLSAVGDWKRELFRLRPRETLLFLHGKDRKKVNDPPADTRLFIINPDGVRYVAEGIQNMVKVGRVQAGIVDELTEYQTKTTDRWKAAAAALRGVPYLWGMTGTPGRALQTFGQMSLINPHPALPNRYTVWRDMVCTTNSLGFTWTERPTAKDTVHKMMQPSIRFEKSDVMQVARPQIEFVDCALTAEQDAAYKQIKKDQLLVMAGGEKITAVNAGVLVSKLLQISAGVVKRDDGTVTTYDVTPRMDALERQVRELSESKVVVFAAFRAPMDLIRAQLAARGITAEIMNGDTPPAERNRIVHSFTFDADPRVLIAHPKTAQYSLELAVADTIVFWGPILSGAYAYEQCKNRILSPRQKSLTPAIVHFQSSAAERLMHQKVLKNVGEQTALMEIFKWEMEGDV
jgi:hypothetical protein